MTKLVSIITPFFNAERYLAEAIESVIRQTHKDWELILINDGSTDKSSSIANSYRDPRIKYLEQQNSGVSSARNAGLRLMNGDFFCFLDADDFLTEDSLSSRLLVFETNAAIWFVDGKVQKFDESMTEMLEEWRPDYKGNPLKDLIRLTGKSFFGPSWMIRNDKSFKYSFDEALTHGEDLYFFMQLARDQSRLYDYVSNSVLRYRIHDKSAMRSSVVKLEKGYRKIHKSIVNWEELSDDLTVVFLNKVRFIMCKSYLRKGQFIKAFRALK